jgi:DNA-directed RNA polymerase subunit E'/Rpb7
MEHNITSPYKNTYQYTKIQLLPHLLNSDIKNNMEITLIQKVEKKCNKNGYIDKIYEITNYSDGYMPPEKLLGAAQYDIQYHCRLCIPIENTVIIAQVKRFNPELIILHNGPITIFIPKIDIDTNNWNISNTFVNKDTKEELQNDKYVKVLIKKTRINQFDIKIKCMGKLIDFATNEETATYFGNVVDNKEEEEYNFII